MNSTWKILQWEVMRSLRSKQFIIGLLITPLIIVIFAGLPSFLEKIDRPDIVRYYVIDEIEIFETLSNAIPSENIVLKRYDGEPEEIEAQVQKDKFAGYFVLQQDLWQTGKMTLFFRERKHQAEGIIRGVLSGMIQQYRIHELEVDMKMVSYLTSPAVLDMIPLEEAIDPQRNEMVVSMVFITLILFLIFSSGTMLMQSASREKRDRMAEIILSSIKSSQLMQGKIIGQFLLGMIQLLFWIGLSLPLVSYLTDFPVAQALIEANLPLIIIFGLLGYLLFSSLYVSIGATMEDIQSAGDTQGLVIMIPLLSVLFITPVFNNPNGIISRFASFFPITSPIIMILRNSFTSVPLWEVIISGVILSITAFLIIRIAGKIFRTGMLLYGKTASIGEIIRWLKYPE